MSMKYTSEENFLQLMALMKAHGVRKVIASPGNTNISFVGSIQNDPWFEVYSCVDERSAAYMACGLAEQSGEPVSLSCTGATAARNYPSGLTEAFYRKLPVLAITSSQHFGRVGQLYPQFTDRNAQFNDIVTLSVQVPYPHTPEDRWANNIKINNALLQLTRNGGGPAHINIETLFSRDFSVEKLPEERVIRRWKPGDSLPHIEADRVCVFVGAHKRFDPALEQAVDAFCERYNGVVLCDQTSNYKGKYRALGGLLACQRDYYPAARKSPLTIHLGEVSGSYYNLKATEVWRVSPDGEVRDPFKQLRHVFQMGEIDFFNAYNAARNEKQTTSYFDGWREEEARLKGMLPELPLSNAWLCQQTAHRLPENAVLHLGILNSLRSWNLYDTPRSVYTYSNVGGFGIDGVMSALVGASLADRDRLCFCVIGDLATFYDLNVLGNRHIGSNVRILVANNGTGFEMHCAGSIGKIFGEDADRYMAAGGHFGRQSRAVLRHFAEDLGFEYLKAESKEEYLEQLERFISPDPLPRPLLFEVFIDPADDDTAYNATRTLMGSAGGTARQLAKSVLGEKGYSGLKRFLGK